MRSAAGEKAESAAVVQLSAIPPSTIMKNRRRSSVHAFAKEEPRGATP